MNTLETTLLIADDDDAHADLIRSNLRRAGLTNRTLRFKDGQEVLDYLQDGRLVPGSYLLLLDIRMPRVDGVEVLRALKESPVLRRIPIVMVTTTDDPGEVQRCHDLGCSSYITKPVDYEKFVEAVRVLGLFLMVIEMPRIGSTGDSG
jgi:CheY-like chemotaxis protein